MKYIIILFLLLPFTVMANDYEYNGVQYTVSGSQGNYTVQFKDEHPDYPSFISRYTRINNISDINNRIDNDYNSAISQVNNGRTTLTGRYNYIYCNYNGSSKNITNCYIKEQPKAENNIPPYIKKKSGIDKAIMTVENIIKDHGNIYIEKSINDNISLRYKSERGIEYVGIQIKFNF